MHLWTEYEGRTIAGAYTLGKLLRSEGRNGFFSTADTTGNSAVIRLTEAHYDEDEQLRRWRQVAEVHQGNLIEIEKVGQTTFEGIALTYALMEPDDANLADVLKERPLTTAETTQVAKSVVAALSALHTSGLVHEHVEAANVLAVGEVSKLRSDCVRECVADGEFITAEDCADLRRRDVHALGVLLLQCLTLEKEWTPATRVPEPFQRVIAHALDGSWTLEQIAAALEASPSPKAAGGVAAPGTASNGHLTATNGNGAGFASSLANNGAGEGNGRGAAVPSISAASFRPEPAIPVRAQDRYAEPERTGLSRNTLWALCAGAALVIALLAWHFLGARSERSTAVTPATVVQSGAAKTGASSSAPQSAVATAPAAAVATAPAAAAPATEPVAERPRTAHGAAGWYVIAYTYNYEDQARAKAHRVAEQHEGFHPEVFSPRGRAPYFVSLGGPMDETEARAVLQRARRAGLARDTFMRRY